MKVAPKAGTPKLSTNIQQLLNEIYRVNLSIYEKRGGGDPQVAARFATTDLYNMYKLDKHIEENLREELKDLQATEKRLRVVSKSVDEHDMLRTQIAQRNGIDGVVPEDMFSKKHNPGIQHSNILQYACEHLGDLVHRLAYTDLVEYGIKAVLSKLNKRYDFHRFWQQLENNYDYHVAQGTFTGSYDDFVKQVKTAGARYADAYTRIPVYTEPQRIAKQIAIDLGRLDFKAVEAGIQKLRQLFSGTEDQQLEAYWLPARHTVTSRTELPRGKKLYKPFRTPGQTKKFAVYVKSKSGGIKLVRFGDPNMRIRQSDPKRRAAFRSRHNCDNKTDKTTPGYWSCQWSWPKRGVPRLPT